MYLFMATLSPHFCTQSFSCYRGWALESTGSLVGAHELSCPKACKIFPDQGLNPCPRNSDFPGDLGVKNPQADALPFPVIDFKIKIQLESHCIENQENAS